MFEINKFKFISKFKLFSLTISSGKLLLILSNVLYGYFLKLFNSTKQIGFTCKSIFRKFTTSSAVIFTRSLHNTNDKRNGCCSLMEIIKISVGKYS